MIDNNPSGNVIEAKLDVFSNAFLLINVIVSAKETLLKLVQSLNIMSPNTGHNTVAVCNDVQPANAASPITLTASGITMLIKPEFLNALSLIVFKLLLNVTFVKPVQFSNALTPIDVIESPKVIVSSVVTFLNALSPILVAPLIVSAVKPVGT